METSFLGSLVTAVRTKAPQTDHGTRASPASRFREISQLLIEYRIYH